jgi:hypothetical protein
MRTRRANGEIWRNLRNANQAPWPAMTEHFGTHRDL